MAAGAAAGKLLEYEEGSAGVGVQTAYGIEVEVGGYPYDPTVMHFMDYRHWEGPGEKQPHPEEGEFEHIPSFLYAMPLSATRVFFEVGSPRPPSGIANTSLKAHWDSDVPVAGNLSGCPPCHALRAPEEASGSTVNHPRAPIHHHARAGLYPPPSLLGAHSHEGGVLTGVRWRCRSGRTSRLGGPSHAPVSGTLRLERLPA